MALAAVLLAGPVIVVRQYVLLASMDQGALRRVYVRITPRATASRAVVTAPLVTMAVLANINALQGSLAGLAYSSVSVNMVKHVIM